MLDQLRTRKASDLDDGQGLVGSSTISIDNSSVQKTKIIKRQPSMFLHMIEQVLYLKSRRDGDEFDYILDDDLTELDELIAQSIISVDSFWDSIDYLLLASAAAAGQLNVVQMILKYVDKSVLMALESNNPLVLAFVNKHDEVVKLLLEHGFDPNLQGEPLIMVI